MPLPKRRKRRIKKADPLFDKAMKNFSITHLRVLLELHRKSPLRSVDFVPILHLHNDFVTSRLAEMVKAGEIVRIHRLNTAAAYRYRLTAKGHALLRKAYHFATGEELS